MVVVSGGGGLEEGRGGGVVNGSKAEQGSLQSVGQCARRAVVTRGWNREKTIILKTRTSKS